MKLTPWFPGSVKPARVGVYERECPNGWRSYNYWTGKTWSSPSPIPKGAEIFKSYRSAYQNVRWRGVME